MAFLIIIVWVNKHFEKAKKKTLLIVVGLVHGLEPEIQAGLTFLNSWLIFLRPFKKKENIYVFFVLKLEASSRSTKCKNNPLIYNNYCGG